METNKTIHEFYQQTQKNYYFMKHKLRKIWTIYGLSIIAGITMQSCNVTRKVTTESSYYQKGDTTCTILVKTIESYDATKKGAVQ